MNNFNIKNLIFQEKDVEIITDVCLFYDNVLIINFRKCPHNKIS